MIDNNYPLKNVISKSLIEETKKKKSLYLKWKDEREQHILFMLILLIIFSSYITLVFLCDGYSLNTCF
jgi:hypothetical protein